MIEKQNFFIYGGTSVNTQSSQQMLYLFTKRTNRQLNIPMLGGHLYMMCVISSDVQAEDHFQLSEGPSATDVLSAVVLMDVIERCAKSKTFQVYNIHFSELSDYMPQFAAFPPFGCLNKTKYCVFKAISLQVFLCGNTL